MPRRRIELPKTVAACHTLILELYDKLDALEALVAQLRRHLYAKDSTTSAIAGKPLHDSWKMEPFRSTTTEPRLRLRVR